jgi:hypothetical protein
MMPSNLETTMGASPEDKDMNTNKIIVISVVTVLALIVVGGGIAFAQSTQPGWGWGMGGYGPGMMGGYGAQIGTPAPGYGMMGNNSSMMGNGVDMNTMHQWMSTSGAQSMHTTVWNGLAETLGLTPDELNAELASGKTLAQIAEAQGVGQEQLAAALETSVKAGLDKAVADGVLTQAQADQMLSQMGGNFEWMLAQMGAGGTSFGGGNCHGNIIPQANS